MRRFLLLNRLEELDSKRRLYKVSPSPDDIARCQVERFNRMWQRAHREIPFYDHWRREHALPERIGRLRELLEFPPLTKDDIQQNETLIFQNARGGGEIFTGGSTGKPVRFPFSPVDARTAYVDIYVGRSWYDVRPLDDAMVFWGHQHLFGAGLRGTLAEYRRRVLDRLLNIQRVSAYDMSASTVARHVSTVCRSDPQVIVGYTSCVYKLARHMVDEGVTCGTNRRLKAVVVTAETVTGSDVELIQEAFGVPLVVEYGLAEAGVIAYSQGDPSNLRVFWDSVIATSDEDDVLLVTTIGDRDFPLVNYRTDDVIDATEEIAGSILGMRSVLGRKRDVLRMALTDGTEVEVNGLLLMHVVKGYRHVFSMQFEQKGPAEVRISVVSDRELDCEELKRYVLGVVRGEHGEVAESCLEVAQVEAVRRTPAGKEVLVYAPEAEGRWAGSSDA
ncbi:MAG: hypothetical protein IH968_03835 [Gemmatimonadetes bacterium]|nr:hypothetical protein [Gemmatimonadota bacterium]